jgi:alanine racemase
LRYGSERQIARWTPLLGKHHLYSILAALRVGLHYNISLDEGLKALSDLTPLYGRMNPLIGLNDCIVIDDSYDATPQSTSAALEWLKSVREPNQRVIFIMGDMDHLGAHTQPEHRQIGQLTAEVADVFITEGMASATAGRAALDRGIDPHRVFTTYSAYDAVNALKERFGITHNDIVMVKGSASMRMERIVRILLKDPADSAKLVRQNFDENFNMTTQPMRPTWVEVDINALASNVRALKQIVGDNVALMAVVKADGYGHGAVVASQTALLNGANYLAVANLQEALELREAAINAPILIMGYTPTYAIREAIRENITVTAYDLDLARAYDRAARDITSRLRVHVKIDTGMGREGVLPNDAMVLFRHLSTMQHLEIEGIYTHFSSADEDSPYTAEQLATFRNVLRPLRGSGFSFKYIHAANSAAVLTNKDTLFNMVRCGIALYGLHPSETVQLPDGFRPVLTWKTIVAQVKTLPSGHPVGYGNTYKTRREETVAWLPIGYADGFSRTPSWKEVLIHGKRAPVIGRVSMEKTVINISGIPNVSIGDEVVLIGKQGHDEITVDEVAKHLGTINYDILCNILPRVPRR